MTESPALLVERSDDVLRLTLNRPEKRNALSLGLLDLVGETLEQSSQADIKCVVLTGAGDRCFAAGGDLKELDQVRSEAETRGMSERGHEALDAIRYFPVPVIAVLNGLALGGGAELAMACDVRIAAAHADFGLIQSRLNVTTAWGGGIDLIDAIGNSNALALLCAGARLPADEALKRQIYTRVCPADQEFTNFAAGFIRDFTRTGTAVLRSYKATAAERRRLLQAELTETARNGFVASWTHNDHWEAAKKALKK